MCSTECHFQVCESGNNYYCQKSIIDGVYGGERNCFYCTCNDLISTIPGDLIIRYVEADCMVMCVCGYYMSGAC